MTNDKIQISNESLMSNKKFDIQERALEFAIRVTRFINTLPKDQASIEYSKQLIRSSASIGANLAEADGALSKKDFINKIAIGRRESRESKYWITLIQKGCIVRHEILKRESDWLINESHELMLILSSIINKIKRKYQL